MDALEQIAAAVLYEGYVLWPYRRSARKNQQRWTFGGVYPRGYVETSLSRDAVRVQTQCVVVGNDPHIDVELRFLHIVERRVARITSPLTGRGVPAAEGVAGAADCDSRNPPPEGRPARRGTRAAELAELEFVDELQVGAERILAWDEAVERRWPAPTGDVHVAAGEEREAVDGGVIVRTWEELNGSIEVSCQALGDGVQRVTARLENTSAWVGADRSAAQRRSFISAHFVLRVRAGAFISLTDPPTELASAAATCQNLGLWPVLVGDEGDQSTLLASPIILYDYVKIAPESPGLLFDSGEIDQLLILNTLTLTDAEKAEVRATDPKAREILDRAEALTSQDLTRLHGALRDFRLLRPEEWPAAARSASPAPAADELPPPLHFDSDGRLLQLERPTPRSVTVAGVEVRQGSVVRLRPRQGADVFDMALEGRVATVESIEQDYDERVYLAVTLEDDPGRDLGVARLPGHRFFFSPDEVEPIR